MNLQDVHMRLKEIRAAQRDPEAAHSLEDRLYRDVLRAIAKGETEDDARDVAECALEAVEIEFPRWCA